MRLSFGQHLQQVQKQILAPRMIQSMEILQLPILALQERIEQEMEENPILELQEDQDSERPDEGTEAESPDAPTEPCAGMMGRMSVTIMFSRRSTSARRAPDAPRPSDKSFKTMMSRVTFGGNGAPTPAQWDKIRLRWSVAVSSGAMRTLASLPKPVLTP